MQFRTIDARKEWRKQAKDLGYLASVFDDPPYWVEALPQPFYAVLSREEILKTIEPATAELTAMGLTAVEAVCNGAKSDYYFDKLKIPEEYREPIRISWARRDRSLYGRFDFSYSDGQLKLLEMNFDTAISLYEASVFQRLWLDEHQATGVLPEQAQQFSRIHECLLDCFTALADSSTTVHFASVEDSEEDEGTTRYLQSCAVLAGVESKFLHMRDIGYDDDGNLIDLEGEPIKVLFKLYPWEFLFDDDQEIAKARGKSVLVPLVTGGGTTFIEPIWKTILANKGILPILWDLYPDSPWLLASAFENTPEAAAIKAKPHVRKPLMGREGGSISIIYPDQPAKSFVNPSRYGKEGFVLQDLHPLPKYDNYHVLIGSWVIAGQPAGIGIRADLSPITTGMHCLFVPHIVE